MGGNTNGTIMIPADPKHFKLFKVRKNFPAEYNPRFILMCGIYRVKS